MHLAAGSIVDGADDASLLGRYARDRDEGAFATLVNRYVALVHSSAVRRVGGDRHLARDVTQAVFLILARKPGSVGRGQPLSAWLLTATRYAAANAVRIESRRRRREEAAAMNQKMVNGACSPDPSEAIVWQDLAEHLDDAVLALARDDRRAVLMRYFEDRPVGEIAAALGCTEGAVRMRLARALEKLRGRLDRATGGTLAVVPAVHLASLLTSHAVVPAPAGLAASATTAALATVTVAASSSTLTPLIAKGAIHMMTWTKAKIAASIVAGLVLAGTGGVATWNHALAQTRTPVSAARAKPAADAAGAKSDAKKADNYLGIVTVDDAPPVIVETSPKSGAGDVDPATTELKITFSKEMQDGSWAWAQISKSTFPQTTGKPRYLEDKRTNVLPVKLEPNHTYVIWLNKPPFDSFMDKEHRKAIPYLLVFQTKG